MLFHHGHGLRFVFFIVVRVINGGFCCYFVVMSAGDVGIFHGICSIDNDVITCFLDEVAILLMWLIIVRC